MQLCKPPLSPDLSRSQWPHLHLPASLCVAPAGPWSSLSWSLLTMAVLDHSLRDLKSLDKRLCVHSAKKLEAMLEYFPHLFLLSSWHVSVWVPTVRVPLHQHLGRHAPSPRRTWPLSSPLPLFRGSVPLFRVSCSSAPSAWPATGPVTCTYISSGAHRPACILLPSDSPTHHKCLTVSLLGLSWLLILCNTWFGLNFCSFLSFLPLSSYPIQSSFVKKISDSLKLLSDRQNS